MKRSLKLVLGMTALLVAGQAASQVYPARPVRLVVPFPPGGSSDAVARVLGERLGEAWKQPIVVENRPGAGTTIASAFVAAAPPDGHVLYLQGVSTHATSGSLYKDLKFDTLKSFSAISNVTLSPFILVVSPSLKVGTARALGERARAKPGALSYGSSGGGGGPHLFSEMFARATGAKFLHVPYKGLAPAVTALIAGEVNFVMADVTAMPQVRAGKVRALAVSTAKRTGLVPGVPTMAEAGIPGLVMPSYIAVIGPADMPRNIVATVNAGINGALATAEMRDRLLKLGFEPAGSTPGELADLMAAEVKRLAPIIREAGVKVN